RGGRNIFVVEVTKATLTEKHVTVRPARVREGIALDREHLNNRWAESHRAELVVDACTTDVVVLEMVISEREVAGRHRGTVGTLHEHALLGVRFEDGVADRDAEAILHEETDRVLLE